MRIFRIFRGRPGIMEVGNAPMAGELLRIQTDGPFEAVLKRDGDHWMLTTAGGATYETLGETWEGGAFESDS